MELLTLLFRLPFLPVKGVIRLTELIRDEAERELYDPANVRHQLEEADRLRSAGEISDEELARIQGTATGRLTSTWTPDGS
jgi:hypothetical protein